MAGTNTAPPLRFAFAADSRCYARCQLGEGDLRVTIEPPMPRAMSSELPASAPATETKPTTGLDWPDLHGGERLSGKGIWIATGDVRLVALAGTAAESAGLPG